ncbi:MAG: SDR family oxidoreductase [Ignavibacteriaceae bacterium]|nr:SDR family oxidoreductase [Ignavibacteriaceae bacterium]
MKIFITGGSGLLGQYLNLEFAKKNEILTAYHSNVGNCNLFNSVQLNLIDKNSVAETLKSFKPQVVIHTAAITSPIIKNNISPGLYFDLNVIATKNLAEICRKINSRMIYISTDLVYAGYRGQMLDEKSKLIPASIYAETKLMGEVKIQETFNNYLILRTALLYGFGLNHSKNHFSEIFNNLKEEKPVKLFFDQFRTPISLQEASRTIMKLCEMGISGEIINLGGNERLSRFELGEKLCDICGFNKNLIEKISMKDLKNYPQVEDVSLNTDKLKSFGIKTISVEDSIREIIISRNQAEQSY